MQHDRGDTQALQPLFSQSISASPALSGRSDLSAAASPPLSVSSRAPRVVFIGGMDMPPVFRLLGAWFEAAGLAALPDHRLAVATLVGREGQHTRLPYPPECEIDVPARTPAFDARAHRAVSPTPRRDRALAFLAERGLRHIDTGVRYAKDGRPKDWFSALVRTRAELPIRYLYEQAYCDFVSARVLAVLRHPAVGLVVGHSFGGSIAFDVIARAVAQGVIPKGRRLRLLTLGTNLGATLTRSPLYASLPRTEDARIACPPNLHWTHFFSPTDLFVAAPARPRSFSGVQEVEVDTGSPLTWPPTRTHSVRRYLCAPAVQDALRRALRD